MGGDLRLRRGVEVLEDPRLDYWELDWGESAVCGAPAAGDKIGGREDNKGGFVLALCTFAKIISQRYSAGAGRRSGSIALCVSSLSRHRRKGVEWNWKINVSQVSRRLGYAIIRLPHHRNHLQFTSFVALFQKFTLRCSFEESSFHLQRNGLARNGTHAHPSGAYGSRSFC